MKLGASTPTAKAPQISWCRSISICPIWASCCPWPSSPLPGWFAGTPLSLDDYPQLIGVGLFSFFGEVVFALPFLLDLMRIPADTFQIFVAVDQFTGRFGTLLAGMHTVVLALLTAVAVTGKLKLNWPKVIRHLVISVQRCCLVSLAACGSSSKTWCRRNIVRITP